MKSTQCMPRLTSSNRNRTPSAISMLDRLREVVFRLIMLTAISKGGRRQHERPQEQHHARSHQPDSYRSQAVEDCIEFFKQSAASAEDVKMSDADEEVIGMSLTSVLKVM
ncbi:hypothetical protein J5N97_021597 [Dioscorea zingiberensis]|uniref:Uncharacterized protein n=1 Tax=Dioscorea zingiberensis TaxID=325984 RepID=A0A9D5C9L7_9LILI|nr:hypothetical protein J5N97_021597 [Dioscorea zingiberensis]